MWIERVEVRGFRGLVGPFEFAPTLTLVVGGNEAGKSSLHELLLRTLFGFSRTERRRQRGTSLLERRAPWNGGPYGVVARLQQGQRSYRVEWEFASHRVQLVDDLGVDLSDEIRRGRDDVELGEWMLGMGIDDFRQVCCIDQDALTAVRNSPSLSVALQQAVAKSGGSVAVEHAIDRLNDFLRSIGARTDSLRPSPAGRLAALERERMQLSDQIRADEQARQELEALASSAALAEADLERIETERETVRRQLLAAEVGELEQRLAEARRLEQQSQEEPEMVNGPAPDLVEEATVARARLDELADELVVAEAERDDSQASVEVLERQQRNVRAELDGLEPYAGVDASARDETREAWAQYETLVTRVAAPHRPSDPKSPGGGVSASYEPLTQQTAEEITVAVAREAELHRELERATERAASTKAQLAALEARQRQLRELSDSLAPFAGVDPTHRDHVREQWARLETLRTAAIPPEPERFEPDPILVRYRGERDQLVAAAAELHQSAWRRWLWIAIVVLTLGVAWLARRAIESVSRRAIPARESADRLASYGGASIEELDARVAAEDRGRLQAEVATDATRKRREDSERQQQTLVDDLEGVLARATAADGGLESRVQSYLEAVEKHEKLLQHEAALARLDLELKEARRPQLEQHRLAEEHERAVIRLRAAYAAAGVSDPDLDRAAEEFVARVAAADEENRRRQEAAAAAAAEERALAQAEKRRRALQETLNATLDRVAAPPAPDLEQRVRAYLTATERNEQFRERQARLAIVERELAAARRPSIEVRRLEREQERVRQRLRQTYLKAAVEEEDLERATIAFDRRVIEAEQAEKRTRDAEGAASALRSLLAGETLTSLAARTADARRRYEEHRQAFGELAPSEPTTARSSERIVALDAEMESKLGEVRSLEGRVAEREAQMGDPAELKERLADVQSQLARLTEAKEAVALARAVLQEAAEELQREFAPHLNEALERNVERITGGRYKRALVDGELNVSVELAGDGMVKSADELSRATKDQLFLIERLEIARLLAPSKGSAPLLLDDPFAHYDRTRLGLGLSVVAEVAEERQVVVFSEDRALIDEARGRCPDCAVIELPSPTSVTV
jgi:DNA repair exonuclease SbcCD ATPase subunit